MNELFAALSGSRVQRVLLLAVVVSVYGISLRNGFVWDDRIFFIGNQVYKNFDLAAMFTSLANGVEYLPLRDITYAFDYLVWGESPFGFHLTNLLFFAANILLIRYLTELTVTRLANISGRPASGMIPFAVAAGFAIHPINAEVANFITCRNVLVSGVFFFLSVICIIRYMENSTESASKWYAAAVLAFVAAMLGKATAIMLPLLLVAILPLLFPGQIKRVATLLVPFYLVAAGFYFIFKAIADKSGFTYTQAKLLSGSGLERTLARAIQIPAFYLKKLLLPYGFSVEYVTGFAPELLSGQVFIAASMLLLLGFMTFRALRKNPVFSFGAAWFIVALLPVLNFFATHPVVADRYAYLPAFGFTLATVSLLDHLRDEKLKRLLLIGIAIMLSCLAIIRSLDWRSDESLWSSNVKSFPKESKGYLNLAAYYFNHQQQQKALELLTANNSVPWLTVYLDYYEGMLLLEQGDLVVAKEKFQKSLDVVNGFVSALYAMGRIADKEGDYVSAAQYYNRALVSAEKDSFFERPAIKERMKALQTESLDKYLGGMKSRIASNPADLATHKDLALTLDRLGFYEEALTHYQVLESAGIKGWQIYHNIGNCYFNMNSSEAAASNYEKALALGGGSEDTFNNLGIAYRKLGNYGKSVQVLEKASTLFPAAPYLQFNLGVTYFDAGDKGTARAIFSQIELNFPDYKDRVAPYLKK